MLSRLALLGLLLCHVVAADRWHNDYRGATNAKTEKYEGEMGEIVVFTTNADPILYIFATIIYEF